MCQKTNGIILFYPRTMKETKCFSTKKEFNSSTLVLLRIRLQIEKKAVQVLFLFFVISSNPNFLINFDDVIELGIISSLIKLILLSIQGFISLKRKSIQLAARCIYTKVFNRNFTQTVCLCSVNFFQLCISLKSQVSNSELLNI